jgi:hypothetical protein
MWTSQGWTAIDAVKFELLTAAEIAGIGLTAGRTYVRICGRIEKDTNFNGTVDTEFIERGGGMIIDTTTLGVLVTAILAAYAHAPYHKAETFYEDGYAKLAYPAAFYTQNGWKVLPAGTAYIEFYDFALPIVTARVPSTIQAVHFCTDKYRDANFDGVLDYYSELELEHACGFLIARDDSGIGKGAQEFAYAIAEYLVSLGPP